jgi:hypothetical protein
VALALAPGDPELLREERRDHQPDAIRHPPLALELAHAGVHEWKACAAVLPGLEGLLVVLPMKRPAVALLELIPRVLGVVQQHLMEEVAPGQRAGILHARLHLERRDAAEVEVGRQPRPADPLAALGLAARHRLVHLLLEAELFQRRDAGEPHAVGQLDLARGADQVAARLALPGPVERREHDVGPHAVHHHESRMGLPRDPARPRERAHVAGEVNALCARLARQLRISRSGGPGGSTSPPPRARSYSSRSARHSSMNCVRAPGAWRPCRRRSSRPKTGTIRSAASPRRPRCGVVVYAQVAREPDDRGAHDLGTAA